MSRNESLTTPPLKRLLEKISNRIKNYNYRGLLKKVTVFLAVVLVFGILFYIATRSNYAVEPRKPYNKEGFIDKKDFSAQTIKLENDRFEFEMNASTTHFSIYDKVNETSWTSHPKGDFNSISPDSREIFTIYYERKLEGPTSFSVNNESVRYDQFAFRIDEEENSVEVLYTVGGKHGLTMDDLPKMLPVDKVEERILPKLEALAEDGGRDMVLMLRFFKSQYVLQENDGEPYYFLRETSSQDSLQVLYDALFVHGGYTEEDFIEDRIRFNLPEPPEIRIFEFSVKYTLENDGFEIRLVNDSIVEPKDSPIAYIDILPYFGSGNIDSDGYIMIPDGSGVLINFNNNKYNTIPYLKRIYGRDYAIQSTTEKMPEPEEDISLPLYGIQNDGKSFINVVENGASMTAIRSGFRSTSADNQLLQKYPYAHYRYYLRERDAYNFVGNLSSQLVSIWTEEFNREDFVSKVIFVDGDDQSYVGMAKHYQNYLINEGVLTELEDKKRGSFNLTLLGGYKTRDYFLGIPYMKVDSLTNVEQAQEIVDALLDSGVDNLNVTYQGWANDGLKPTYMSRIDFNKVVGSKKDFKAFQEYLEEQGVQFIPEVYINTAYSDKRIKVKDDVIYNMFWDNVVRYDYNLATHLPDRTTTPIYTVLPTKASALLDRLSSSFKALDFNAIGFVDFGNELTSSFHKENVIFRFDAEQAFIDAMNKYSNQFDYIMVRNPDLYAMHYLDLALDVPTMGTNYRIVDQSIPFLQLVFNGYIDYSGKAINLDDQNSIAWHMLKAIETGSSLHFTWSYEDTIQLTHTEYSRYFSTYYKNWIDQAIDMYHDLDELGIYSARLVDHEILSLDGSIVQVRYDNGLTVKLDYNTMSYEVLEEVV